MHSCTLTKDAELAKMRGFDLLNGRVKLNDTQDLVASLVDDEKLDPRVFVKSDSYTGATERGLRFYLHDENWKESKKLIDKVNKVYEEIA